MQVCLTKEVCDWSNWPVWSHDQHGRGRDVAWIPHIHKEVKCDRNSVLRKQETVDRLGQ